MTTLNERTRFFAYLSSVLACASYYSLARTARLRVVPFASLARAPGGAESQHVSSLFLCFSFFVGHWGGHKRISLRIYFLGKLGFRLEVDVRDSIHDAAYVGCDLLCIFLSIWG